MNIKALRKELDELREQAGIYQPIYCSDEESLEYKMLLNEKKPLPEGVYVYEGKFFTYIENELSEQEFEELLKLRKNKYLSSIEKRLVEQNEHLSSIRNKFAFLLFLIITLTILRVIFFARL